MADKVNQPAARSAPSMAKKSPPLHAPSTDKKQPPEVTVAVMTMEVTSSTTSTVWKASMANKVNQPAAPLAPSMAKQSRAPLPARSTDKKQPPEVTVAVSTEVTSVTTVSSVDKKPLSAILFVCLYALFNACLFCMDAIVTIIKNRTPCTPNQSTWFWKCVELTDAAAAEANALVHWQLRCSVAQAVYAAVALLLTVMGRRCRSWAWTLAFVALVATAATHCMSAMVDRIFLAATPGDAGNVVVDVVVDVAVAVLDMGFLCLLLADGEE